jgi:hypothetical protein
MGDIIDDYEQISIAVEGAPSEYENFILYEKVDTLGYFSVTPTTITVTNMPPNTNPTPYLRRTGTYGDFGLKFALRTTRLDFASTLSTDGAMMLVAMFTRNPATKGYSSGALNDDGLLVMVRAWTASTGIQYRIMQIRNFVTGADTFIQWNYYLLNTDYYVHFYRISDKAYVEVYTTETMDPGSMVFSTSIPVPDTTPFSYFLPMCSRGSYQTDLFASGSVWNYILNPGV